MFYFGGHGPTAATAEKKATACKKAKTCISAPA